MITNPLDETHDPDARSWVVSANDDRSFPIQNLPFGIFDSGDGRHRGGVAIGHSIVDIGAVTAAGLFEGEALVAANAASGPTLNSLLALGAGPRRALRRRLFALLKKGSGSEAAVVPALHDAAACSLHLPAAIGDYTDFYTGINHAQNVGKQFRPDNPLLPNYKHVPIGYHGRASSVRVSGAPVYRPKGQTKAPSAMEPSFGPSKRLDYELEIGVWVGPGNALGQPISIKDASAHIAGFCLLNDWSARDIQAWEYQPLGPFLAKNFLTTVSPWIVTAEALAPYRTPQPARPAEDPKPLDYLLDREDQQIGAYAVTLVVGLTTPKMREQGLEPYQLSSGGMTEAMYWTVAQLVAHHTSGGCNLRAGDLLGTGTLSGLDETSVGSLLEKSKGGSSPIMLPTGEQRCFLEDGDAITITGLAEATGRPSIGFGECSGMVAAS